jgi:HSP20 family protein
MATDTRNKDKGAATNDRIAQRSPQRQQPEMRRWEAEQHPYGPFAMMRDMQDQIDRWFNRVGFGSWTSPSSWVSPSSWTSQSNWTSPSHWLSRAGEQMGEWSPAIDAFQRGNEFIIRADVPGMNRNDVSVEIGDDAVTLRGERKGETHDEREGMYWTERSYGSFSRVVPLPAGAISDSAKANFHNGVLEVVIQAPSQEVRRGRKIDITAHDETAKK